MTAPPLAAGLRASRAEPRNLRGTDPREQCGPVQRGAAPIVEGDTIFVSPEPTREESEAGSECASPQVMDALEVMRSRE